VDKLMQTICLASQEYAATLVKVSPTGKELNFEIDFQLPMTASLDDVATRLDKFLRNDLVRKTLNTLKGHLIHIRVLHLVEKSVKFQSI
jgi:hypothetical protein